MPFDCGDLEKLAKEKEEENWEFRGFLKFYDGMSDKQIDKLVFELTERVWSAIDCTECGRCCEDLEPMVSNKDQKRLAERLEMAVEQLREQYLEYVDADDEKGWRIKNSPCPFLRDKKCSVYDSRPENCRDYPYLYKPDFNYRTWVMIERTFTCPIVFEVMEQLKEKLDFLKNR